MAVIDVLLDEVIKRGGSDLHLAVNQPPFARIRGEVVALREDALSARELEDMLLELVTPAQRERLATDLDLDLSYAWGDVARFRASYYVKNPGIAATFRAVPLRVPSLAAVGAPEVMWRVAALRSGLVLVGGPASNGKTTLTAALVDHVSRARPCHVLTIENPIEFVHGPERAQVTQREIGTHAPTFAAALRNAAREDPDVVVVSELPSAADTELALDLASSGVLVIANVTASGVVQTLDRVIGAFAPERREPVRCLLAEALRAVVVQHLVRSADSKVRVAVHEILMDQPSVASLLREDRLDGLAEVMRAGSGQGMQTLDVALERLLAAGKIGPEAALERSVDKEAFARVVARAHPELAGSLDLA